jgi:peptidoglycan/LPS O-acetylase OafA/YrhL
MTESTTAKRRQSSDSYPLATMFVFVALIAALIGVVTGSVSTAADSDHLEYGVVIGCGSGIVIGSIVGLYHHRRIRGLRVGLTTGGLLGAALGPAFANSDPQQTVTACLVGSAIIVSVGVVYSVSAKDD